MFHSFTAIAVIFGVGFSNYQVNNLVEVFKFPNQALFQPTSEFF